MHIISQSHKMYSRMREEGHYFARQLPIKLFSDGDLVIHNINTHIQYIKLCIHNRIDVYIYISVCVCVVLCMRTSERRNAVVVCTYQKHVAEKKKIRLFRWSVEIEYAHRLYGFVLFCCVLVHRFVLPTHAHNEPAHRYTSAHTHIEGE